MATLRKILLVVGALVLGAVGHASVESKTWPASKKAREFVKDTVVIGFLASPHGAGWTRNEQLLDYFVLARSAGITGHSMTLAATVYNWDDYVREHQGYRRAMAEQPDRYTFVRSIRDIETAHIQGTTAVIWNSQTSTIIDGDLNRIATLKEMGIGSMMLVYNDTFRAGSGQLAAYNGQDIGLTDWGKAIIDEMVKFGIILDLSHTGSRTANDAMDYMEENYPGLPVVYTHAVPAGLYLNAPNATLKGCYRAIPDDEAIRAAKLGGYVSPTFTEWMMDRVWPEDITPLQAAQMIDYYVKLIGVDHVGIATDDMFSTELVVKFARENAAMYNDGNYMIDAFDKGATGNGELAKILPAITDELWNMGYSDEDLARIYGGNKMRVYQQVWEGVSPEQHAENYEERVKLREELRKRFMSR
jgi:membrane dipeptidase